MAITLFTVTGTYNAVVINSESYLASTDLKFVKRLDELYGVTVSGRDAASIQWQKLPALRQPMPEVRPIQVTQDISTVSAAPAPSFQEEVVPQAAVQEELSLNLVEVINPKKWQNGLNNSQFTGNLTTNQGVIESLEVSLPNGEGVSVSFSEMTGNVFEYDYDGELYSGMMYQVDQNSYMVTLSNGPLEGTRMRFTSAGSEAEQQQEVENQLAENNIEVGNFGNDSEEYDRQQLAEQTMQDSQNAYQDQMVQNQEQYPQEQQSLEQMQGDVQNYDQQMQQQAMLEQQGGYADQVQTIQ